MKDYTVIGYYDSGDTQGQVYAQVFMGEDEFGAFEACAKSNPDSSLVLVCAVEGDHQTLTPTDAGESCSVVDYPGYPEEADA